MKSGAYLASGIAMAAVLVLARPAFDVDSHKVIPAMGGQQEAAGPSSGQTTYVKVTYPLSVGRDSLYGAAATVASTHDRRVAPWASSPLSGPIASAPIANFGMVEQGTVYRSAQPTESDYRWLLSQGIKSVVSFRREKGDDSPYVLGLGFRGYLWLNIEDEREPSDEQAEFFLDFVTDPQNWPVLIHCKVGLGRTGTMAALIRYAIDGWSMADAIGEARLYRGGVDLVPSQLEWLDRWATTHPPASHRPMAPAQIDPL